MNNDEQQKIMSVDSLIVLSHILDDYEKFDHNIQKAIKNKNYIRVSNDLSKLKYNKNKTGGKIAKELYRENKDTIDTINRYSNIGSFLYYNDNWHKNSYSNYKYDLDYFYNYLDNNKEKLGKIKSVLIRIKNLGIQNLELNEKLDLRNNIYEIDTEFNNNKQLYYVDNIVIVPNYSDNKVKYKTLDSPYEISTKPDSFSWGMMRKEISRYHNSIKLNSLVFNSNRLPRNLKTATVFDSILYLKKQVKDTCNNVRDTINLSISINELSKEYNYIVNNVSSIITPENEEFISNALMNIRNDIKTLEFANNNYQDELINNSNISKEQLKEEKVKILELKNKRTQI